MLFDTHVHLDQPEFDADRAAVIERAIAAGVETMLTVGIDAATSRAAVRLANQFPSLHAAVGIQPNYCGQAQADDFRAIETLCGETRVVAIGETGLDRYWDHCPMETQREYFARHLALAQTRQLPVIVHCREAEADVLPMLCEAISRGPLTGVMHSFSGDATFLTQCLDLGLFISLSGAVTYTNKKFESLRKAARLVPADRLLLETDGPYLTPHPLRGKQRRNEPALLRLTAESLAQWREVSLGELAAQTTRNARQLLLGD